MPGKARTRKQRKLKKKNNRIAHTPAALTSTETGAMRRTRKQHKQSKKVALSTSQVTKLVVATTLAPVQDISTSAPVSPVGSSPQSAEAPQTADASQTTVATSIPHNKPKHRTFRQVFAVLLLTLGINMLCVGGWYIIHQRTKLAFQTVPIAAADVAPRERASLPSRIHIDRIRVDLTVEPAEVKDGEWPISRTGTNFLTQSARPSEGSNTVIYGHNYKNIFGHLKEVKIGDEVVLTNTQGHKFTYVVESTRVVKPTAVEIIAPTPTETLTLYTCVGFLDQDRLVIHAVPTKVEFGNGG